LHFPICWLLCVGIPPLSHGTKAPPADARGGDSVGSAIISYDRSPEDPRNSPVLPKHRMAGTLLPTRQ
jgi:hypothetical protein